MAVVLLPVLIRLLPESLIKEDARLTIPFAKLFADGRTRFTILIWIIFFANLMELYIITSWLPTTLNNKGLDLAWANIAVALVQLGGVAERLLPRVAGRPLWPALRAPGGVPDGGGLDRDARALGLLDRARSSSPLSAVGAGTVGAQNCNNGIAAKFYPTEMRATGIGWALAVGRIGSIIGPAVGGLLLATGPDAIFVFAMVPPLVAAAAYLVMGNPKELSSHDA